MIEDAAQYSGPITPLQADAALPDLLRVLDSARRYLACRERAVALWAGGTPPPRTLGEAVDLDFLAFDLAHAEHQLRAAVGAFAPDVAAGFATAPAWDAATAATRAPCAGNGD